jgi:hypothetical protein
VVTVLRRTGTTLSTVFRRLADASSGQEPRIKDESRYCCGCMRMLNEFIGTRSTETASRSWRGFQVRRHVHRHTSEGRRVLERCLTAAESVRRWHRKLLTMSIGADSSISQTDSMIPIRKDSHSSKCAIFATRLDTSSSRLDTCFIRSWDLPALSKAICAWRFIKDRRLSRSEILGEYSSHRQKERGGKEVPESNMLTGDKAWLRPDDSPAGTSWKSSKKRRHTSQ